MRATNLISPSSRGSCIYDTGKEPLPISVIPYSFTNATPTAELEPITETYVQGDEVRQLLLSPPRIARLT